MTGGWRERCSQNVTLQTARRIVIAVVGFTIVAIGIALLVLPGPGLLVILLGLALLGTEFVWAKRWLQRLRNLLPSKKSKDKPLEKTEQAVARGGDAS